MGAGRCVSASVSALASLALWPHHIQPPESSLLGEDDPWRSAEGLTQIVRWLSEVRGGRATLDGTPCPPAGIPAPPAAPPAPPTAIPAVTPAPEPHPAVGVRETASAGRGLFAETSPITAGQLLLRDAAHAVVLAPQFRLSRCAHCLGPLADIAPCLGPRTGIAHCLCPQTGIATPACPCAGCGEVYCDSACREAAREAWHGG